jgi:hypothetical protein
MGCDAKQSGRNLRRLVSILVKEAEVSHETSVKFYQSAPALPQT